MLLPSLLLALLADSTQARVRRARVQELSGRLRLGTARGPTGTRGRLAWIRKTFPPVPEGFGKKTYDEIVASWLRNMGLDPDSDQPSAIDYALPWMAGQFKRVYTEPDFGFPRVTFHRLGYLRDWLSAERRNLSGMDIFDALQESRRWHIELEAESSGIIDADDAAALAEQQVLFELPGGWRVVELQTASDLTREGDLLGHCLGTGGYGNKLHSGSWRYLSVRDAENRPRVTIELEKWHGQRWPEDWRSGGEPEELELWSPRQVRGKGNALPVSGAAALPTLAALDAINPVWRTWGADGLSLLDESELSDLISEERDVQGGIEVEEFWRNMNDGVRQRLTANTPNLWHSSDLSQWDYGDLLLLLLPADKPADSDLHAYILINLDLDEDDYDPDEGINGAIQLLAPEDENLEVIDEDGLILPTLDPAPLARATQKALTWLRQSGRVTREKPYHWVEIRSDSPEDFLDVGRQLVRKLTEWTSA